MTKDQWNWCCEGDIYMIRMLSGKKRPMNPIPIVVGEGHIILMFNTYPESISSHGMSKERHIWDTLIKYSNDGGKHWSLAQPVFILEHFNNRSPYYCAIGPGHGIKLDSGRLVVTGHTKSPDEMGQLFVIVSDDDGKTWKKGGDIPFAISNGNAVTGDECQAVEVAPNSVVINCRTSGSYPRMQCYSSNGCDTFGRSELKPTLIEPKHGCEGSILGFGAPNSVDQKSWVLFSNPANENARCNLSVRLSTDGCNTWSKPKTLQSGDSAYSDLIGFTHDCQQKFACLFERLCSKNLYHIDFVIFTIDT
ncbi:sialidase-4-like [Anneissia japonica]|uniref:sialidase-4-like n=1 Tax=Anneissia japonica TaxID=1529436 RepID=UPI001425B324|nr:sialidase-4-like [Anneissia japonica]